jgi:hypothetical protein
VEICAVFLQENNVHKSKKNKIATGRKIFFLISKLFVGTANKNSYPAVSGFPPLYPCVRSEQNTFFRQCP